MPSSTKKKLELSFTNWVLGGSLVTLAPDKNKDSKKSKRANYKVLIVNEDGTTEEIEAPEHPDKYAPSLYKKGQSKVRVEVESKDNIAVKQDRKDDDKDGKTEAEVAKDKDDKSNDVKVENENKEKKEDESDKKGDDAKAMKWCKTCKIPSPNGTEDTMPEGARFETCMSCGWEHWIKQYEDHSCDKPVEEGKKDDENKDFEWTSEQDKTISKMKSDGKPWKEIASALGSSKSNVQHRYKELMKEEKESKKDDEEKPKEGGDQFGHQTDEEVLAGLDALLASFDEPGDANKDKNDGATQNTDGGKEKKSNYGAGGGKKDKKHKKQGGGGDNQNKDQISKPGDGDNEDNGGGHGGYNFSGPQIYGKLKPDSMWSKDDCDVLENMMERYEGEKWLHMQAGFYNWTGRMVAAEFIEKKFKHDTAS
ncbi:hypothetical protein EG329_006991 [Mollisiaceae sp. DMI_Dod_QoI]|nr:hypothetical protein EG329_006991 [Helotiales sp. DMI_Dod_QoI]